MRTPGRSSRCGLAVRRSDEDESGCMAFQLAFAACAALTETAAQLLDSEACGLFLSLPELFHGGETVGDAPVLDHLAVLEAVDLDELDRDRTASRRYPHECSKMRAVRVHTRPDFIARRNHIFECVRQIW